MVASNVEPAAHAIGDLTTRGSPTRGVSSGQMTYTPSQGVRRARRVCGEPFMRIAPNEPKFAETGFAPNEPNCIFARTNPIAAAGEGHATRERRLASFAHSGEYFCANEPNFPCGPRAFCANEPNFNDRQPRLPIWAAQLDPARMFMAANPCTNEPNFPCGPRMFCANEPNPGCVVFCRTNPIRAGLSRNCETNPIRVGRDAPAGELRGSRFRCSL